MPRESAASLAVRPAQVMATLLQPRAGTPEPVAAVFRELVASVAASHFRQSDRPMVEELARSVVILREAGAYLDRDGLLLDGEAHPLLKVIQKQQALAAMLQTRLRLTPQSRIQPRGAGREPAAPGDIDFTRLRK